MKAIAALALTFLAAAPTHGGNAQTFLDSTGENPSAPDITSVVVSNDDGGLVTFKVNISNRPALTPDMEVDLYLDTDANMSTGDPDALGAEYVVILIQGEVDLAKWSGTGYVRAPSQSSLVYSYDASGATIKIKTSDLGATKTFGLSAVAGSGIAFDSSGSPDYSKASVDYAPDLGHGTYTYDVRTTLRLRVTTFQVVPASPRAGGTLSASLAAVENDTDEPIAGGTVACRATLAGKALQATSRSVANGVATCVWRVPKTAKGRHLSGTVTVTVRGAMAAKSFSAPVR